MSAKQLRRAAEARAGTGSAAQPASASPAQAESDTAALHEIIRLLWRGHVPQRVLRAGGTVRVVAEEVGGLERMERLLELATARRRPGVDARQEKRRRAGQDPLPERLVVLDQEEVDQAHLFHISGNIHVLRCMLAHPCTSTQDLLELARGWARIVQTQECQRSVANDLHGCSGVEDRHVGTSRLMLRNLFGAG